MSISLTVRPPDLKLVSQMPKTSRIVGSTYSIAGNARVTVARNPRVTVGGNVRLSSGATVYISENTTTTFNAILLTAPKPDFGLVSEGE